MSQLFCIKRDGDNVTEYVRQLRNDKETSDVTLVGNDGGFVLAHRNVLLPNSDYIKEMLRRNPSPSPLIRIPEVNSKELCRILDFIYYGKIVMNIEDMEKFIQQSKVLKVKGMSNDTYTVDIQSNENEGNQPLKDAEIITNFEENSKKKEVTLGDKYFSIDTDIEIVDVNSKSKPVFVPSLSIDVNSISPAPNRSTFFAHSIASKPVSTLPPLIKTFQLLVFFLASIATTMHWLPNFIEPSLINFGFLIAALFIETLSAPASKKSMIPSTSLIPPPTVSGTKQFAAVFFITSSIGFLFW